MIVRQIVRGGLELPADGAVHVGSGAGCGVRLVCDDPCGPVRGDVEQVGPSRGVRGAAYGEPRGRGAPDPPGHPARPVPVDRTGRRGPAHPRHRDGAPHRTQHGGRHDPGGPPFDIAPDGTARIITHEPYTASDPAPDLDSTISWQLQPAAYDLPDDHRLALVVNSRDELYSFTGEDGSTTTISSPSRNEARVELPLG